MEAIMKKFNKGWLILVAGLAAGAFTLTFAGCSKKAAPATAAAPAEGAKTAAPAAGPSGNLVVWSFTDELQGMITKYYTPTHPNVHITYSMTPTDQFPNKLDPVLTSGDGAPDVFALEDAFVRKYIEEGPDLLLPLDDIYAEAKDKLIPYPTQVGSYKGHVYGMSWQATPGAVFYRRSLAKKYFGTDDPDKIQEYFKDMPTFFKTADELKAKSKGICRIISTTGDLFKPYSMGARKQPWVVDGKLYIDPAMIEYMDACKELHDKNEEGRVGQWSEGWFAAMKGELKDEKGTPEEAFCFFLPTWGLHYVLKQNAPKTAGDWAMIPGPLPYRWGGTWIAAYKGTKNPQAAKDLIKYLTTDDAFLTQYAKDSGDFVDNMDVVNKIKDGFKEDFLGGQDHYAVFAKMAMKINGNLTQGTDQAIEGPFQEAVTEYVNGKKTKDQAIAQFKKQVQDTLGIAPAN
jgi:ABC-type glycerol-3-phosphate transport system substrate-binding protein